VRFCDSSAVCSHPRACATAAVGIALAIAGCDSARGGGRGQLLTPDADGWVDRSTTGTTGIQGAWYAYTDRDGCLPRHAAAECSTFVPPDLGSPSFAPTGGLGMCAVGVAAKVVIAGSEEEPDWSNIWGARIGFDLAAGQDYDAPAHGVTGLAFHIDGEPARGAEMRIFLPTATANLEAAWWGGATAATSPVHAGRNEIRWADVGGPNYMVDPPPFDPNGLRAIQFGVAVDEFVAKSFAFCINELTALTD